MVLRLGRLGGTESFSGREKNMEDVTFWVNVKIPEECKDQSKDWVLDILLERVTEALRCYGLSARINITHVDDEPHE